MFDNLLAEIVAWQNQVAPEPPAVCAAAASPGAPKPATEDGQSRIISALQKLESTLKGAGKRGKGKPGQAAEEAVPTQAVRWVDASGKCTFCKKPGSGPPGRAHTQCSWCRYSCQHTSADRKSVV